MKKLSIAFLESTAYHEAGHAVASWALGSMVHSVSIVPNDDSSGRARIGKTISKRNIKAFQYRTSLSSFEGETSALRYAVINLAGLAAQRKHSPRRVLYWHGSEDYKNVNFCAEQTCCDDHQEMKYWFRRALRRTERLIEHKWLAVDALAKALIKKNKLSSKEAVAAMQSAYALPKYPVS